MAEDIKYPSWREVGLPDQFATTVANLKGDNLLEQLIYEKVFLNTRRMQYVYSCGVCGHLYKPEKNQHEEYSVCERCSSRAIHATQHLRGWNRKHPPGCSNSDGFAQEVMFQMRNNYATYFGRYLDDFPPEDIVTFRWRESGFAATYLGGGQAVEANMAKALCKAALLVPFLWDGNYDWKNRVRKPDGRQSSILPVFYEWVQRG